MSGTKRIDSRLSFSYLRHAQRVATNVQRLASLETISNATDVRRMARELRR